MSEHPPTKAILPKDVCHYMQYNAELFAMEKNVQVILKQYGLTEKEIAIYIAVLTIGTSTASSLAHETGMTRSMAQYICQMLLQKGILTMRKEKNTFLYAAEPPEKLVYLLRQQQQELKFKEEQIHGIMSTLKGMMNPKSVLPKVEFYEGVRGIEELYEQILDLEQPLDTFEDNGELVRLVPDCVDHFIRTRKIRGIYNRVICPSDNPINATNPAELRETRMIDAREYPFSGDIAICGDMVSIFSFDTNLPVGIAIRHPDIVRNFKVLFNQMWKMLGDRERYGSTQ